MNRAAEEQDKAGQDSGKYSEQGRFHGKLFNDLEASNLRIYQELFHETAKVFGYRRHKQ
jgi:hypothetical protein